MNDDALPNRYGVCACLWPLQNSEAAYSPSFWNIFLSPSVWTRDMRQDFLLISLVWTMNSPSSYFAERNLMRGVTLLPYCGLLRLLHHPLKERYFCVWSHGRAFSSRWHVSCDTVVETTRVTSMFVRPSAKSSMLTLMRLPVTCEAGRSGVNWNAYI